MPTTREETLSTDSMDHDRLNTEAVSLMRQETGTEPREVELMGKKFIVLPEVFYLSAIQHTLELISHSSLKIVADELARRGPTTPLEVLEIGPGVGHFVIGAASLGPNVHVTAVDISPAAVENVTRNAVLHGVADRVRCAVGDVYSAPVTEGKTFDLIFWDPPFSKGDPSLTAHVTLERAVWDPDYAGLTQYIGRAREFLRPAGRLLLAWNNFFGDGERLEEIASKHGWSLKPYGIGHVPAGLTYLTILSYELIAQEKAHKCATCGTILER